MGHSTLSASGTLEVDLSRLKLKQEVGIGRSANVYCATLDGRDVAVKKFKVDDSRMSEKEKKDLQREINIMKDITHPLLVNLVGVVLNCGLSLIMEFCPGGDLFTLLHTHDEVPLSWCQQVKMCCDVAQAMCFLHNSTPQIIHRDLKSLNLLLVEPVESEACEPRVKVADFGQSRMMDKANMYGEIMTKNVGTQHWMAPEVLKGMQYDEKVDVYSYAMILFEIICREIPFEEYSPKEVAVLASRGQRPDLDAVPHDCPQALVHLMKVCWKQEPASRPSFEDVITTLCPLKLQL